MCTEKGGSYIYFALRREIDGTHHFQLLKLRIAVKSVTAFPFHCSDPHALMTSMNHSALHFNSSGVASRVACTVLTIPPPRCMMLI